MVVEAKIKSLYIEPVEHEDFESAADVTYRLQFKIGESTHYYELTLRYRAVGNRYYQDDTIWLEVEMDNNFRLHVVSYETGQMRQTGFFDGLECPQYRKVVNDYNARYNLDYDPLNEPPHRDHYID